MQLSVQKHYVQFELILLKLYHFCVYTFSQGFVLNMGSKCTGNHGASILILKIHELQLTTSLIDNITVQTYNKYL